MAAGFTFSGGTGVSRWTLLKDKRMHPEAYRVAVVIPSTIQWQGFYDHNIQLEWEIAGHYWRDPWLDKSKHGVSFTPMFRYRIPIANQYVFIGFGVGATYIDAKQWMDRQLGSRFMFEDRFEAGLEYAQHRLSFSVNHYSNAKLAEVNHGVNVQTINYSYFW
ncbi:acyloxyacyl hydrolase [Alteromonadaceae bacterium BrNp21-10]|nr:acyloxyacyl hydrolase [Alteromonadaceae bacterium BrNp21-10]